MQSTNQIFQELLGKVKNSFPLCVKNIKDNGASIRLNIDALSDQNFEVANSLRGDHGEFRVELSVRRSGAGIVLLFTPITK